MLKEKFLGLIGQYSTDMDYHGACWQEIETQYSAKSRYYHNLEHLEHMISGLEQVKTHIENLDALLFSIYYHDIIYKPTKSNNEHQSTLFFEKRITNTSFDSIPLCMTQIEATKAHQKSTTHDTNILLDLDLSILGQPPDTYYKYTKKIRKEYRMYPNFMYRKGRKKVLSHFLALESIFKTDFFKNQYEQQARENLNYELNQLQ